MRRCAIALLSLCIVGALQAAEPSDAARKLAQDAIIVDTHIDAPENLIGDWNDLTGPCPSASSTTRARRKAASTCRGCPSSPPPRKTRPARRGRSRTCRSTRCVRSSRVRRTSSRCCCRRRTWTRTSARSCCRWAWRMAPRSATTCRRWSTSSIAASATSRCATAKTTASPTRPTSRPRAGAG